MRDIKRIEPIMNKVKDFWEKHQDLRFSQMLDYLISLCYEANGNDGSDIFFWEEDKWSELLDKVNTPKN